jgi:hypothetical protein
MELRRGRSRRRSPYALAQCQAYASAHAEEHPAAAGFGAPSSFTPQGEGTHPGPRWNCARRRARLLRPEATKARLSNAQAWLLGHARQLMAYTALILGAYLAVSGLVRLS